MEQPDLTSGNVRAQLWSLAWPTMLSVFFYTLYNIVDAWWVSKLSAESIAAVSISQITLFIMISLGFGITVGSGVLMAMQIGAKNLPEAERILGQSFVLSAILGVLFTALALVVADELLAVSGASGAIFAPAKKYFVIFASGSILLFLMAPVIFSFNSQGDTHTLTKLFAISTGMNLVLDPILIFGRMGFPAMGISGAAVATIVSMTVFIVISVYTLSRPSRKIRFRFSNLNARWDSVKRVMDIGFPAALTQVIFPVGLAVLTWITSMGFREPGAIAFSLGFRIEFFAYLPAIGFGFGAMAMIGQNLGARNLPRARESFDKALLYAFAAATGLGLLAAVGAKPLIGIFTNDAHVTAYARSYMGTVAMSYGFMAVVMVVAPAFQAMGRSWPGFWIFLLRVAGVAVPLSYLLTRVFRFPIQGVWASVVAGNVVAAAAGWLWITRAFSNLKVEKFPAPLRGPSA